MSNKHALIRFKRPHRARLVLEDGQVLELTGSAIQSVLGYSEWNDVGELKQLSNGDWKFIPDSELICENRSQSKEMVKYNERADQNR